MRSTFAPALLLAGCAALASVPAQATTMFEEDFTCPVGGEEFQSYVIGSYSSFGQRPDGRSYGTLPIFPIVECPGNGFLLFQDEFSESEIATLAEAVASPEYQAMRTSETTSFRAWWLMETIGADPYALAAMLMRAGWEADGDPAQKQRYQAAFAAAAMALDPAAGEGNGWLWLNLRAANALRELAQFDEAAALLDRLDRPEVLPADPEDLEGARYLIDGLKALVADANPFPEPTNLVPPREASYRCVIQGDALTGAEAQACAGEPIRQEIAHTRFQAQDGRPLSGEEAVRYIAETYRSDPES